ncbi:MAG: DUF523 domain-containing protein [Calditrichaeota bacterium]|nr:DUF523 domain-containing protein [Calditrichota bacterium]
MVKVLVSACLLGEKVRYDGKDASVTHPILTRWHREGRLILFCPEVAGGLPVPRPPAEIVQGNGHDVITGKSAVVTWKGEDVTRYFLEGARRALSIAIADGVRLAILKEKSPSCGKYWIYDGHFSGNSREGPGVTTAMLQNAGIRVFNEKEIERAEAYLRELESS